jgi:hypothetical protein
VNYGDLSVKLILLFYMWNIIFSHRNYFYITISELEVWLLRPFYKIIYNQSSRNVSVLLDMTSKIWADFAKDWYKIGILQLKINEDWHFFTRTTKPICNFANSVPLLHLIECNMICYGALKSNIDQGHWPRPKAAVNIAFQCSITHHIARNEVL